MITNKRLSYLLIGIIALLLCALTISVARANDIDWHLAGYVTGEFAGGAGYSPGVGVLGEAQARWRFLEGKASAGTAWQHKADATFGYTYGVAGQLRAYMWRDLYVVGAYNYHGYESRFDNGVVWAKHGHNFGGGVGWANDYMDVNVIAYNKETGSPNDIWYAACNARFQIWRLVWAMWDVTYMTFDQMHNGRMERWEALNCSVGLGVRW
jgi:hypothetical protein